MYDIIKLKWEGRNLIELTITTRVKWHFKHVKDSLNIKTIKFDIRSYDIIYDEQKCKICNKNYMNKDNKGELKIGVTGCDDSHTFHVDCLRRYLNKNKHCPTCKQKLEEEL